MAGWGNPDVDRIVTAKGQPLSVVPRDPEVDEVTGGVSTGRKVPNQAPTYRMTFGDGTYLDVKTSQAPDGSSGAREVVGGSALASAAKSAAPKPPETKSFPDGSLRQYDETTKQWDVLQEKPAASAAPTLHTLADGSTAQWNPKTNKWDVVDQKIPKGEVPDLALPARRPGQKTDLTSAKQGYDAYRAQLQAEAQQSGDWIGATRKAQAYYDANVKPVVEQAAKEAADYEDETRRQQAEAHGVAVQNSALANRREDRLTSNDTRRQALDEQKHGFDTQKFAYDAGQDAVKTARVVSASRLGSGQFGEHLAAFLGGGAGSMPHFTADDLRHQEPDYEAIAANAARKALEAVGYGGGGHPTVDAMHGMFGTTPQATPPPPALAAAPPMAPRPAMPSPGVPPPLPAFPGGPA